MRMLPENFKKDDVVLTSYISYLRQIRTQITCPASAAKSHTPVYPVMGELTKRCRARAGGRKEGAKSFETIAGLIRDYRCQEK